MKEFFLCLRILFVKNSLYLTKGYGVQGSQQEVEKIVFL